jgi:Ca2+:H+ antiporter
MTAKKPIFHWTVLVPILAWIIFFLGLWISANSFLALLAAGLIGCVIASVHHAETIAHRVGEPFGTLVLAIAVTIIEVALIVSLMLAGGEKDSGLARDTVFAAVMIILNGMVGLAILVGALKHKQQSFEQSGVSSSLTVLVSISVLTLILPNYTKTTPGPFYSNSQLAFVAVVTLVLYGTFIIVQNFRHREYFLDNSDGDVRETQETQGAQQLQHTQDVHDAQSSQAPQGSQAPQPQHGQEVSYGAQGAHDRPSNAAALGSVVLLLVCLVAVVLIAKKLAPALEHGVAAIGAPKSLVGVIIACVVLLPEGLAAIQAAKNNKLQKALNLSLGSALASIGLTIPTVSMVAIFTGLPLSLGIDAMSTVLFVLSLLVISISLSTGKTTILQGMVLLVIFSVYLFMTIIP